MKNKKQLIVIVIALVLAIVLRYVNIGQSGYHQVLSIADGDTIIVDMFGESETIRLIGVDTPETHHPNKPVQCYGPEASDYTTNLLAGEFVQLLADPLSGNRDRYDRLLRYVIISDGSNINLSLVEQGYGFAVEAFDHSRINEFTTAQKIAETEGRGLWSSCEIDNSGSYPSTSPRTSP